MGTETQNFVEYSIEVVDEGSAGSSVPAQRTKKRWSESTGASTTKTCNRRHSVRKAKKKTKSRSSNAAIFEEDSSMLSFVSSTSATTATTNSGYTNRSGYSAKKIDKKNSSNTIETMSDTLSLNSEGFTVTVDTTDIRSLNTEGASDTSGSASYTTRGNADETLRENTSEDQTYSTYEEAELTGTFGDSQSLSKQMSYGSENPPAAVSAEDKSRQQRQKEVVKDFESSETKRKKKKKSKKTTKTKSVQGSASKDTNRDDDAPEETEIGSRGFKQTCDQIIQEARDGEETKTDGKVEMENLYDHYFKDSTTFIKRMDSVGSFLLNAIEGSDSSSYDDDDRSLASTITSISFVSAKDAYSTRSMDSRSITRDYVSPSHKHRTWNSRRYKNSEDFKHSIVEEEVVEVVKLDRKEGNVDVIVSANVCEI